MMARMLLTTALLVVANPWASRAADDDAEKAVAALSRKMTDALVEGDIALLDAIMADDWIIIDPEGKVVTKAESLGDIRDRSIAFHVMDKSELKSRLYGDTAVVNGRLRVRFTFLGKEVDSPTRFTEVYVRQAGRWRCVLPTSARSRPREIGEVVRGHGDACAGPSAPAAARTGFERAHRLAGGWP